VAVPAGKRGQREDAGKGACAEHRTDQERGD
jgi:hypothetical protein